MIELLRMAVTVLQSPTFGVNAQIAALTLNPGDARPPNVFAIVEPSTAHTELRDEILASGPYIIVDDGEAPRVGAGQPFCGVIDSTVELLIGYFAKAGDDRLLRTQGEYSVRAICQAIDAGWFTSANRPIYGRQNGIGVMGSLRKTVEPIAQSMYGSILAARVRYELQVRDLTP